VNCSAVQSHYNKDLSCPYSGCVRGANSSTPLTVDAVVFYFVSLLVFGGVVNRYDPEFASDFEDAYLMLSSIYIRTKKFDLALQLCKRCLEHNKACGKAWEDMGLIMEKETS
jgi:hypothetical protein